MRLPRVRFTVRRLMVAVAVVAMAMGGYCWMAEMRQRAAKYRDLAERYWLEEMVFRLSLSPHHFDSDEKAALVHGLGALRRKYEHAACYPWLPVSPDPPMTR